MFVCEPVHAFLARIRKLALQAPGLILLRMCAYINVEESLFQLVFLVFPVIYCILRYLSLLFLPEK